MNFSRPLRRRRDLPFRYAEGHDRRRDVVLETAAEVGKMGSYRIRMTYAVLGNRDPKSDCVLFGQEILSLGGI